MDLEINQDTTSGSVVEKACKFIERDQVSRDVFVSDSSSCSCFEAVFGKKEVGGFVGHACGGGGTEQWRQISRGVAGFFDKFTGGAVDDGFFGEFFFISDESGADFKNPGLDWPAILFHEDDLTVGCHRENAHDSRGIGASREFPVVDFTQRKEAAFVVENDLGHVFTIHGKESVAKPRMKS